MPSARLARNVLLYAGTPGLEDASSAFHLALQM
jgi:hypothetical protein